jgi:hypothetical protein
MPLMRLPAGIKVRLINSMSLASDAGDTTFYIFNRYISLSLMPFIKLLATR